MTCEGERMPEYPSRVESGRSSSEPACPALGDQRSRAGATPIFWPLIGFSIVAPVDLGRSPNLLVLGFAESFIEGIACPAHADDRITFATGRQCFVKASYVDIDRPVGDVDGWPPNKLQKVLPRKDAPGPLEQTLEQPEFLWPEMDGARAPAHSSGLVVDV
jgi:hypothetical protein